MSAGNFVAACLPSITNHLRLGIQDNPETLSSENINKFLKNNVNKMLSSVGLNLSKGKKLNNNIIDNYIKKYLNYFHSMSFLNELEFIIDSGGFQIQQGYLMTEDIPKFIDLYYEDFMINYSNMYNYAFNLDIAPGASYCPFKTKEEMYELNKYSFSKAKIIPKEAREKLIYIHHFRTPSIHDIYKKLLFEDDLANGIPNFSTGGLVSFSKSLDSPCILYIIPLLDIIHYCKEKNINKFRFHVLGGSEWREILGHKFLEKHIKEVLGLDITITFDSSTFFKGVCMGRYFYVPCDNNIVQKLSFKQTDLTNDNKICLFTGENFSGSFREIFYQLCNEFLKDYNMPLIDNELEPIYNKKGSLTRSVYVYMIMQTLRTFNLVEKWCEKFVNDNYSYYNSDEYMFNSNVEEMMIKLSGASGINLRKMYNKSNAVYNSLKMIDEYKNNPQKTIEKCSNIVKNYLSTDDNIGKNEIDLDIDIEKNKKNKRVLGRYKNQDVNFF